MLTVVEYREELFYVIGSSKTHTDGNYFIGLKVDSGTFESLYVNSCKFQYFVDEKGHKLDLNLKRIKEKENKKKKD